MVKPVSYTKLESVLNKIGSQLNAAETHGMLTGMLSMAVPKQEEAAWRATLLENMDCSQPNKQQWDTISKTGSQIIDSFSKVDFSFNILLPDDEVPLEDRISALGSWCRGYLSGLGLVGITPTDLKNDIVKELVHDLSQIAHVSVETDASDEDEAHFIELVEFVRVAAQNIKLELQGSDQKRMLH